MGIAFVWSFGGLERARAGRKVERRKKVSMTMVLSEFLGAAGEYPIVPGPVAPVFPRGDPLVVDASVKVEDIDGIRGLAVTKDVEKGDLLASLKRSEVISVERKFSRGSPLEEEAERVLFLRRSFWGEELRVVGDWRLRLALKLLVETRTNTELLPYFALLPKETGVPVFWNPTEVTELQHFELQKRILRQKVQWETICELIMQNSSALDVREVLWAMDMVRSRAFSGEFQQRSSLVATFALCWTAGLALPLLANVNTDLSLAGTVIFIAGILVTEASGKSARRRGFLAPIADMMNHFSGATTGLTYDALSDSFQVRAGEKMKKGSEVLFDYNEKGYSRPNDELLQYYGFVNEENKTRTYLICDTLNQFFDEKRFGVPRRRIRELKVTKKRLKRRSVDGGGVVLSIDVDGKASFNDRFMNLVKKLEPSGTRRQQLMTHICRRELEQMPTTIQEDRIIRSNLRSQSPPSPRKLLAVNYRIENKRLLMEAAEYFSRNDNDSW
mmetsp:Transcript_37742/g.150444  ORF Transcript_37742/g.150444 Transcript_37742/m.150444 type:complete len:500 (-) Transcript_37742:1631-3130(-)